MNGSLGCFKGCAYPAVNWHVEDMGEDLWNMIHKWCFPYLCRSTGGWPLPHIEGNYTTRFLESRIIWKILVTKMMVLTFIVLSGVRFESKGVHSTHEPFIMCTNANGGIKFVRMIAEATGQPMTSHPWEGFTWRFIQNLMRACGWMRIWASIKLRVGLRGAKPP